MQKRIIGTIGTGVMLSTQAFAQTGSTSKSLTTQELSGRVNTITTAVPFLMICPDSKQGGMGEVGAATPADGNSIHWNVAKMAFAEKKEEQPFLLLHGLSNWYRIFIYIMSLVMGR